MTNRPPFGLKGLDHVVLRTGDVQRLVRFYRDVLGCTFERELPKFGLTQLRAGSSLIDILDAAGPMGKKGGAAPGKRGHNMDHLCLRIDPFNKRSIRTYLTRHGVTPGKIEPRFGAEGRGPSIYLNDPDGNTVELKGPVTRRGKGRRARATRR
jgi:catechol 2,3-dioxygenase-like lactoylglutathione lyase family enzyme